MNTCNDWLNSYRIFQKLIKHIRFRLPIGNNISYALLFFFCYHCTFHSCSTYFLYFSLLLNVLSSEIYNDCNNNNNNNSRSIVVRFVRSRRVSYFKHNSSLVYRIRSDQSLILPAAQVTSTCSRPGKSNNIHSKEEDEKNKIEGNEKERKKDQRKNDKRQK